MWYNVCTRCACCNQTQTFRTCENWLQCLYFRFAEVDHEPGRMPVAVPTTDQFQCFWYYGRILRLSNKNCSHSIIDVGTNTQKELPVSSHDVLCLDKSNMWCCWVVLSFPLHSSWHPVNCQAVSSELPVSRHDVLCVVKSNMWCCWVVLSFPLHSSWHPVNCQAVSSELPVSRHDVLCLDKSNMWCCWVVLSFHLHSSWHPVNCQAVSSELPVSSDDVLCLVKSNMWCCWVVLSFHLHNSWHPVHCLCLGMTSCVLISQICGVVELFYHFNCTIADIQWTACV